MSVSLQKGQKISLSKEKAGLKSVMVGLGWDAVKKGFFSFGKTAEIDCDASVFLCGASGKIERNSDVVYFGNLKHRSGAVTHLGDNRTGDGDGDDEQILVNLSTLPSNYTKIIFVVNIYEAAAKKQHFGLINNAYIRIVDGDTNAEMCRFDLKENYDQQTAMVFGELYLHNNEWKFNAIGNGTQDKQIKELAARFM